MLSSHCTCQIWTGFLSRNQQIETSAIIPSHSFHDPAASFIIGSFDTKYSTPRAFKGTLESHDLLSNSTINAYRQISRMASLMP